MVLAVAMVALMALVVLAPVAAAQEIDKKTIKTSASSWEKKADGGTGDFAPELTLDGKLDAASSWRADGKGQWIQYDLGTVKPLTELKIAFLSGDKIVYKIDILASKTGADKEWLKIDDKATSTGKSADYESFKLGGRVDARYIRIVGQGNNSDKSPNGISLTEVSFIAAPAQPSSSAQPAAVTPEMKKVLYDKPFSDEMMKDWTLLAGKWTVVEEDKKPGLKTDPTGMTKILIGDKAWADYGAEVRGRVDKWTNDKFGDYGIIARYVDPKNFYLFLYDSNPKVKALIIQKKVDGKLITIGSTPFDYKTGQWYSLRGVVSGDNLEFYVDGKKMVTATATEFKSGQAGLLVWLTDARLEGFKVLGR
jgi:hypothetical protein